MKMASSTLWFGHAFCHGGKTDRLPTLWRRSLDCRKALINTRGATFFNLGWLNRGAFALTCQTCSRVEWFRREPAPRN